MSDEHYFLSQDCFVCRARDHWIVLNTGRDRYLCVMHTDLCAVGHRLDGWESPAANYPTAGDRSDVNEILDALVAKEIITSDRTQGKPFTHFSDVKRERSLDPRPEAMRHRIPLGSIVRVLTACTKVDIRLRTMHFANLIRQIGRRNRKSLSGTECDPSRLSILVDGFSEFRPLYPRPYLCLFDSLALQDYLAMYQYYPQLIIGVAPDPFEAHCWLQDGTVVINDDLERINKYIPIFAA